MRQRTFAICTLFLIPIAAWGHPGHGANPGTSLAHVLTDHSITLWIVGAVLSAGVVAWRRLRS